MGFVLSSSAGGSSYSSSGSYASAGGSTGSYTSTSASGSYISGSDTYTALSPSGSYTSGSGGSTTTSGSSTTYSSSLGCSSTSPTGSFISGSGTYSTWSASGSCTSGSEGLLITSGSSTTYSSSLGCSSTSPTGSFISGSGTYSSWSASGSYTSGSDGGVTEISGGCVTVTGSSPAIVIHSGDLIVSGSSYLGDDSNDIVKVKGEISGSGNVQIAGNTSVEGTLKVTGSFRARQIYTTRHYFENGSNDNFKFISFMNASDTNVGAATYTNSMVAPFDGRLVRVLAKIENNQNGNVVVSIHTGSGLTVSNEPEIERVTVSMPDSANAVGVFNTTGSQHFNAGSLIGIGVKPNTGADPGRVSMQCIWEYDTTGIT